MNKERKLILAEIEEQLSDCKFKLTSTGLDKKDLGRLTDLVEFYRTAYLESDSKYAIRSYDSAAEIAGRIERLVRFEKNPFRTLIALWEDNTLLQVGVFMLTFVAGIFLLAVIETSGR